MSRWWSRLRSRTWATWQVALLGGAVVGLPLLVAAVALSRRHYSPVLDLAMTEFRVRDVGSSHTPLIGLPGRIGRFPAQGSHPGPLSFYVVAPLYRLLGSSGWSLLASAIAVNVVACGTAVALAFRKGGWRLVAVVALWLAVAIRGYGTTVLTQPWNPYLPLMAWTVVVLAAWMVVDGDHRMLLPMVVAGTLCAQTHVPYLVLCVGLFVVVTGVALRRDGWGRLRSSVVSSVVVGVVLWLPPLVDQAIHTPGNISMLKAHFASPTEQPIGVGEGLRLLLRHFDIVHALSARSGNGGFVAAASAANRTPMVGLLVLCAWGVAIAMAWRLPHRSLRAVHSVLVAVVLLETISMVRIFGKVWYYLTLWAWSVTVAVVLASVATFGAALMHRWPHRQRTLRRAGSVVGALVAGACSVIAIGGGVNAQVPEHRLSDALGAVVPATVAAIRGGEGAASGHGAGGRYLVTWTDAAFFGSQGYGLVNELERAGLRVGVDPPFAVPVTFHRVLDRRAANAEIHLATGAFIDEWRARSGWVEVASSDVRTDDERARFAALRAEVRAGLAAEHLDEVFGWVDTNLFRAANDPRVPVRLQRLLATMLEIGEPVAVFVGPVGG